MNCVVSECCNEACGTNKIILYTRPEVQYLELHVEELHHRLAVLEFVAQVQLQIQKTEEKQCV